MRLNATSAAVLGPFVVVAVVGFGRRLVVPVTVARVWITILKSCGFGTALAFRATLIARSLITIKFNDIRHRILTNDSKFWRFITGRFCLRTSGFEDILIVRSHLLFFIFCLFLDHRRSHILLDISAIRVSLARPCFTPSNNN